MLVSPLTLERVVLDTRDPHYYLSLFKRFDLFFTVSYNMDNGTVIELPAYWQRPSVGTRTSSMNRVYVDWLKVHVGAQKDKWETANFDFYGENLAFKICDEFDAEEIKVELTRIALFHYLKYGPSWSAGQNYDKY